MAIKIATCAIAGGFIHLYAALDNNLFEKYGVRVEHVGIRGSSPSLAALAADDAFAKALVNRRMVVPANAVAEAVEVARETGAIIKRKPDEIFDNVFAEHLEKSGFLKELWGGDLPRGK